MTTNKEIHKITDRVADKMNATKNKDDKNVQNMIQNECIYHGCLWHMRFRYKNIKLYMYIYIYIIYNAWRYCLENNLMSSAVPAVGSKKRAPGKPKVPAMQLQQSGNESGSPKSIRWKRLQFLHFQKAPWTYVILETLSLIAFFGPWVIEKATERAFLSTPALPTRWPRICGRTVPGRSIHFRTSFRSFGSCDTPCIWGYVIGTTGP